MAAAGPGLYSDIGKKARGTSRAPFQSLALVSARGMLILLPCWLFTSLAAFVGSAGLLYKDYHTDRKFTLTTYAANGAVSFLHSLLLLSGACFCDRLVTLGLDLA